MLRRTCPALALMLLAGCSALPGSHGTPPTSGAVAEQVQAAQLAAYMGALQTVVQGSPAEQAEVLASARTAYEQVKQGPAALRYALLLAAPAHPARDPALAQRLLREVLARPELLSGIERALAIVESARVENELGLATENQRLVADAQQERERARDAPSSAALARQLKAEMDDNARLRKELDVARAKLEAISDIERTIPDRQPAKEVRKP